MNKIVQRMKEPSTWAGLAVLALSFGLGADKVAALGHLVSAIVPFMPVDGGVLAQTIIAAAGGVAVVLPETKHAGQASQ